MEFIDNKQSKHFSYFLLIGLLLFSFLDAMEEKNLSTQKQESDSPELIKELLYDIIIARQDEDSNTVNYFSNSPFFYPDEQTVAKIETAFMAHLVKKNEVLKQKFDADQLNSFMNQILHFARYTKPKSPKYRLNRLFEDVRTLDSHIPYPAPIQSVSDCCTKTIHNTDCLDTERIDESTKQFYSNTISLWKSLNEATRESVTFPEFVAIRHRILDYYNKRLNTYLGDHYTETAVYKKFIPAALTFPPGITLAGFGLGYGIPALGILGLVFCGGGLCSLALLQSNEEQECEHHDQEKVKKLRNSIENYKKAFTLMAHNFNK